MYCSAHFSLSKRKVFRRVIRVLRKEFKGNIGPIATIPPAPATKTRIQRERKPDNSPRAKRGPARRKLKTDNSPPEQSEDIPSTQHLLPYPNKLYNNCTAKIFPINTTGSIRVYPIVGYLFPACSTANSSTAGWLPTMPPRKEKGMRSKR